MEVNNARQAAKGGCRIVFDGCGILLIPRCRIFFFVEVPKAYRTKLSGAKLDALEQVCLVGCFSPGVINLSGDTL